MIRQHREFRREIKPFVSVAFIVATLFSIVFLKMEERRRGYEFLKLTKQHHQLVELKRQKNMQLAKVTRPQLVERLAHSQRTLQKVQNSQIIHLTGTTLTAQHKDLN